MQCGFLPGLSQHSLLCGAVAHHPYAPTTGEGGTEECEQMAADLLGTPNARILLLENHGEPRAVRSLSRPPVSLYGESMMNYTGGMKVVSARRA